MVDSKFAKLALYLTQEQLIDLIFGLEAGCEKLRRQARLTSTLEAGTSQVFYNREIRLRSFAMKLKRSLKDRRARKNQKGNTE